MARYNGRSMRRRVGLVLGLSLIGLFGFSSIAHAAVRAQITWNHANDIDLHVTDDAGNEAYYANPTVIPNAVLSPDITNSGGPETFTDNDNPSTRHFRYKVCYFDDENGGGPTTVSYVLTDPGGAQRSSSVVLTSVGDCVDLEDVPASPPVANCDVYWVKEHGVLNIAAPGVLGNDSDPAGSPLTATVDHTNFAGNDHPYSLSKNGALHFEAKSTPKGKPFVATIDYHVTNSQSLSSPQTTIRIYIQPNKPSPAKFDACAGKGGPGNHGKKKGKKERVCDQKDRLVVLGVNKSLHQLGRKGFPKPGKCWRGFVDFPLLTGVHKKDLCMEAGDAWRGFDEISPDPSVQAVRNGLLPGCVANPRHAVAFFGNSIGDPAFATRPPKPFVYPVWGLSVQTPGYGSRLLELYGGAPLVYGYPGKTWSIAGDSETEWVVSGLNDSYGAIINIGATAPSSDSMIQADVKRVCDATNTGKIGLWAGSENIKNGVLTPRRLKKVVNGLNACMTKLVTKKK